LFREIVVQFNADVADGMQWKFIPAQREVNITYLLAPYKKKYCFASYRIYLLACESIV